MPEPMEDVKPAVEPMDSSGEKEAPENGNTTVESPSMNQENDAEKSNDEEKKGDDSGDNEADDLNKEEEELFNTIEVKEAEEEAKADHSHDPAPKLLQKAIEAGEVKAEDLNAAAAETATANGDKADVAAKEEGGNAENAKDGKSKDSTNMERQKQLEFLLNKASEYSNFIARDLEELQADGEKEAKKLAAKVEKASKRRKNKSAASAAAADALKKGNKKAKTSLDAVRTGSGQPIFIQPPNLAAGCLLKDYQLEGVRWLSTLFENGVSGILADEMGLGKTIQCVALIAHLLTKGVSGPFMVVAPLATLPNWVREFEKWLPTQQVVRYHGPEREALLKGPLHPKHRRQPTFPFIVTSYETAIRDQNKLEKLTDFSYVIVDEGHRLKNHRCTLLRSLKRLKATNRLLLTGTPIQNTLDELWSLLNFVNPLIFDDLSVFQSWFGFKDIGQKTQGATNEDEILAEQQKNQTITKLHSILRPFLLRRVKKDVLKDMPPKKEVVVYSGVSKLQAGYAELIDQGTLRDTLLQQGIEEGRFLSQTNKQMNHRKNINHPFLFGEPKDGATGKPIGTSHPQLLIRASGKFALLDRMLSRLHADGHQVLIFSQMTSVLNVMEDYLLFRDWKYFRIDGSTNIDDRQKQMDQFNAEKTSAGGKRNKADDRYFCFLLSTRAGGLGINLTSADTCIIFDSDWNPHADSQAMDRCHRIGQELPVAVYRLLTVNSVDIEMMEKQISKKKLERMTIAGGDFRKAGRTQSKNGISFQHLTNLLQSDIKDLSEKGGDVENIKISDEEFDSIMDRKRLFATGDEAVPTEGKMYDVIEAEDDEGDMLSSMRS
mmetsp:Transcript_14172/g.39221  ORF Transcript_14172/g.39221 Transcript_14172/m.39221 type:complete len:831 (-) Transcript_14172:130-2622(-)